MIKYAYTILYVSQVKLTLDFYRKAFGFELKFMTPEEDYGELLSGETTIAFAHIDLAATNIKNGFEMQDLDRRPFGIELAFTTEDPEGLIIKAIDSGGLLEEALKVKPWGQKVAYIRDINGFLIEICTPMS